MLSALHNSWMDSLQGTQGFSRICSVLPLSCELAVILTACSSNVHACHPEIFNVPPAVCGCHAVFLLVSTWYFPCQLNYHCVRFVRCGRFRNGRSLKCGKLENPTPPPPPPPPPPLSPQRQGGRWQEECDDTGRPRPLSSLSSSHIQDVS